MNIKELQEWLNINTNSGLVLDGMAGNNTKQAILKAFTNKNAPAISEPELESIAKDLGDTDTKRIKAVAIVESSGSGWDNQGRVKILFERHLFYKYTTGSKEITNYCNSKAGGYNEDSWDKFISAMCIDPDAALKSISIGKFQVLGKWYKQCGYNHPIDMLLAAANSEYAHYKIFCNYVLKVASLQKEFLSLQSEPEANIPFAQGYNGYAYAKYQYHIKLAKAMSE